MRRLTLSIEGEGASFPALEAVAGWLEALEVRSWLPGGAGRLPPPDVARRDLPGVATAAVRHPGSDRPRAAAVVSLFEEAPSSAGAAIEELVATLEYSAAIRSPWVIVELAPPAGGRPIDATSTSAVDRALDRLCRAMHAASLRGAGVGIALALPRARVDWLTPARVRDVLEDLGNRRAVAWWHDSGRAQAWAAQGGPRASDWLDALAARCVGVDATDAVGAHSGLPAGAGEVDLKAVLGALKTSVWVSVRSDPFQGPGPLLAAVSHLRGERG